jgi:CheY-like chemotaxis protein
VAEEGRSTQPARSILIVDDEPAVRALAARILRDAGHDVIEAASGDEALAAIADHPELDLLLTDILMRGMSGSELAERLCTERPGLRVLFMSGYPPKQVGIDPTRSGHGFIEKPFAPAELNALVSRTLAE